MDDRSLGDLLSALARCLQLAQASKDVGKAIRHLERGLALCSGREREHPALAVEAARLRLNLGASLSRAGRHIDALTAVVEAHRALEKVLDWARSCGDASAAVIAEEAAMLHCAALVAEAIETQPLTDEGRNEQLYAEARSLAEQRLAPRHPMVALTQQLQVKEEVRPCTPKTPEPPGISSQLREGMAAGMAAGSAAPLVPGCRPSKGESPKERRVAEKRPERAAATGLFRKQKGERHDIFADFINEDKMERELGRGGFGESRQDDMRKQLVEMDRFERLRSLGAPLDLHDVKYSRIGHKLTMKAMSKTNGCRSDPQLLLDSKTSGESPEAVQVRKLRGHFDVKEGRRMSVRH